MSEPIKVFELAKELDIKALDLIEKIRPLGLKLKNHMVELSPEQVAQIRDFLDAEKKKSAPPAPAKKTATRKAAAPKAESAAAPKKAAVKATTTKEKSEEKPAAKKAAAAAPARRVIVRREGKVEEAPPARPTDDEIQPQDMLAGEPVAMDEESFVEEQQAAPLAESSDALPQALEESPENSEAAPEEGTTAPSSSAPAAAAAAAPGRRLANRYSVIRVVKPEDGAPKAGLRVVEEAKEGADKPSSGIRRRTEVAGSAATTVSSSSLLREAEEKSRNNKAGGARNRANETQAALFKSTDFLRRERTYQPKKKKVSIGQSFKKTDITQAAAHKRVVDFDSEITVSELAEQMAVKARDVLRKLKGLGAEAPDDVEHLEDWPLDLETAQLVANEFSFELRDETFSEEEALKKVTGIDKNAGEDPAKLKPRPPVITIMGHVDHGKTSLLDCIRRARVVTGEAGGITQHIGAYTIDVKEAVKNLQFQAAQNAAGGDKKKAKEAAKAAAGKGKKAEGGKEGSDLSKSSITKMTFLDTPGHAAFTSMRARGAKITDIVVLVVAANDGVMPQTKEAVEHAKAAGVPIIVAVNKIDLPEANAERVTQQLSELGLLSEAWGGDVQFVPLSAKTAEGVDKLLEAIQLQAEVMEIKANPDAVVEGAVIEAKLDKGRGPVCSVLVQRGTLRVGQFVVVGTCSGKIRAMIDDKGAQMKEALPSTPVEILGMDGVPEAGDTLNAVADERAAKELVQRRQEIVKEQQLKVQRGNTLEELFILAGADGKKELAIILKADVKGSAEAIQAALMQAPQDKVRLKILSLSVGAISANDVLLASASKAMIFGFGVRPDNKGLAESERLGVPVKTYDIIYNLIDDVKLAMEGLLEPTIQEKFMGRAEVRNTFSVTKIGTIAGCMVIKGKVMRSNSVRLLRDGRVIFTGKLSGLKRFKDDAREVAEGFECGMSLEGYQDIKVGDVIEAFVQEEIRASLGGSAPSANA